MMDKRLICIIVVVATGLIGCVTSATKTPEIHQSLEQSLYATYWSRAQNFEKQGKLTSALENYKLALTVNPEDKAAKNSLLRVKTEISDAAVGHYKKGLKLNSQARYKEARNQFLMALALRPAYPEALDEIKAKQLPNLKNHIIHKVRSGDTLSKLAQLYYEDFRKYPLIAKYNGVEDATQLRAGQEIRIPRSGGLKNEVSEEKDSPESADTIISDDHDENHESNTEPPIDQAVIYRELGVNLFMEGKYEAALIEFEKVLKTDPEDKMAIEFSYRSHYQIALSLFKKKDYLSARNQFTSCLRYKANCQKCHTYIQQSEAFYKEAHYRKGIQYFEAEKLDDAIHEWKLVSAVDPDYRRTKYLIEKAETILRKIEEIKKGQSMPAKK